MCQESLVATCMLMEPTHEVLGNSAGWPPGFSEAQRGQVGSFKGQALAQICWEWSAICLSPHSSCSTSRVSPCGWGRVDPFEHVPVTPISLFFRGRYMQVVCISPWVCTSVSWVGVCLHVFPCVSVSVSLNPGLCVVRVLTRLCLCTRLCCGSAV